MPLIKPRKGEPQNDFIGRCMSDSKIKGEFPDNKQRQAVCFSQFKKGKEKLFKDEATSSNDFAVNMEKLNYCVEFNHEGDESGLLINGTALTETTSRNNVRYNAEVIKNATDSLKGVRLLKDHNNSVDSIVGFVSDAQYNEDRKAIEFKAKILDSGISEKIKSGLIKNVSIGASFKEVKSEREGTNKYYVPGNIEFLELSLVAVPGVVEATIDSAIAEFVDKQEEKLIELERKSLLKEQIKLLLQKQKAVLVSALKKVKFNGGKKK